MNIEEQIIQALELRPLSQDELVHRLDATLTSGEINSALYQLSSQKMWIAKHGQVEGSCKTCACQIIYKYKLTYSGREALKAFTCNRNALF
jgi:hypothetical protein